MKNKYNFIYVVSFNPNVSCANFFPVGAYWTKKEALEAVDALERGNKKLTHKGILLNRVKLRIKEKSEK